MRLIKKFNEASDIKGIRKSSSFEQPFEEEPMYLDDELDRVNKALDDEEDDEYIYDDDIPYGDEEEEEEEEKYKRPKLKKEHESDVAKLTDLISDMLSVNKIKRFWVNSKDYDISIQILFNKKERMSSIMKVIEAVKKIHEYLLIQYDSEIDMWETNSKDPLLDITFYYKANKPGKDDPSPFKSDSKYGPPSESVKKTIDEFLKKK